MPIGSIIGKVLGKSQVIEKGIDAGADLIKTGSVKEQGSRRHQADMLSDNRLSKNIRPLIAIWAICMFTAMIILSVLGYSLEAEYKATIQLILGLAVGFYYPARTLEKYLRQRNREIKKD